MSKDRRHRWLMPALVSVFVVLGAAAPGQNFEFRLSNIERRIDQVQGRVDGVEREQRMLSLGATSRPEVARETVLELQRQQNSLAEQLVTIQRQMLDMKKTIDRLEESERKKEEPKPKVAEPPRRKP
ncbi:MAG: hypothetical protein ABI882_16225 [Acidobacteriota bacterium]